MQSMQWEKLLSSRRLGTPESGKISSGRSPFQQDFDRIVFSESFRSLHDKAQVFPLSDVDQVRTRLTHSMETASIGRSLGAIAGVEIVKHCRVSKLAPSHIGEIVAAASLAHDIGNPPLGHSGEDAIRYWFKHSAVAAKLRKSMAPEEISDIEHYEGNAQGFRVVTQLEMPDNYGGMQLTCATLAAMAKYPVSSCAQVRPAGVAGKKYNFFQDGKELFRAMAEEVGLLPCNDTCDGWCRHPLAFLVEAADDVTYRIVDFEDGHLLKLVSYGELERLMLAAMNEEERAEVSEKLLLLHGERRKVEMLRARVLGSLVRQLTQTFLAHETEILEGRLLQPLIELIPAASVLSEIYDISIRKIYTYRRATEIGIAGYELTSGLLDVFMVAVEEYVESLKNQTPVDPYSRKMLYLLPDYCSEKDDPRWMQSSYYRLMRVLDCVTGMTDTHAVSTFKKIKGISLPGMVF